MQSGWVRASTSVFRPLHPAHGWLTRFRVGSTRLMSPFRTRFRSGSGCACLNLATPSHSLAHSTKGTPSQGLPCSDRPEAHGFRISFTPLAGVLFTVPSQYWFPIGRLQYLALGGGPPRFPPDSACPAVLTQNTHAPRHRVAYGALTLSGRPFQWRSAAVPSLREGSVAPSGVSVPHPARQRRPARTPHRFGLLPVRSPLLGESSLFLRVLRCFSSPTYLSSQSLRPLRRRGCPIRLRMAQGPSAAPHPLWRVTPTFFGSTCPGIPPLRFVSCLVRHSSAPQRAALGSEVLVN